MSDSDSISNRLRAEAAELREAAIEWIEHAARLIEKSSEIEKHLAWRDRKKVDSRDGQ